MTELVSPPAVATPVSAAERWRHLPVPARIAVAAVGLVIGFNLLLTGIDLATGGPPPAGPPSSSYATAPAGLAAYADLLAAYGHPVRRLRAPLDEARLDPGATVVVADPTPLTKAENRALRRFVHAGGRLVAAGADVVPSLRHILGEAPVWAAAGTRSARPLEPVPEVANVSLVRAAGSGSWTEVGATLPVLGNTEGTNASSETGDDRRDSSGANTIATLATVAGAGTATGATTLATVAGGGAVPSATTAASAAAAAGTVTGATTLATGPTAGAGTVATLATVADVGAGRVVALADPSPLQNALLDEADNAAFAVAVAGERGRAVTFAEAAHGYRDSEGLSAIPGRWRAALAGAVAATLMYMWSRGRRHGPPEDEERAMPPPRRDYVDAMAASLARTRQPARSVQPLQEAARRRVARRAGLPPDADDAAIRRAAAQLGVPPEELAALFAPPKNDRELLAVGRATTAALATTSTRPTEETRPW